MRFFAHERHQPGSWSHRFMPGTGVDFWHTASFPTKRARFWPELSSHRKPKVTSVTLQSLVLLLRWAPSAVVMISGTHMHSSFENMTKTWQTPSTYKEQHSRNRKKFYFSKLCLWGTDTFKTISTSYTKPPVENFTGAQKYFLIFFLVKTGGRDGKSATQRKQIWNYPFWLELYVLLGNMGRGDSKHYLYAGQNLFIFLDCGFSTAVLLYVTELHKKIIWYKCQDSFRSLKNTNLDTTSKQVLLLLPLIPKKIYKHNKIIWKL